MFQTLEIVNEIENAGIYKFSKQFFSNGEIATNHNIFGERDFQNKISINNSTIENCQFGEKLSNVDETLTNDVFIPEMPLQSNVPYNGECIIFDVKLLKQFTMNHINNRKFGNKSDNFKENKMEDFKDEAIFNVQNLTGINDVAFLPHIPIFEPFKHYVNDINEIPTPLFKIQKSKILSLEKFNKRIKKHRRYFKCRKCENCARNMRCQTPLITQDFNAAMSKKYKACKRTETYKISDVNENQIVNDINNGTIPKYKTINASEGFNKNEYAKKKINGVDLLSIPSKTKPIISNDTFNKYINSSNNYHCHNDYKNCQKNMNFNGMVPMLNVHTSNAINSMASMFINNYPSNIY